MLFSHDGHFPLHSPSPSKFGRPFETAEFGIESVKTVKTINRLLRKIYYRFFRYDMVREYVKRGLIVGKNFAMLDEVIIDYSHTWHIQIGDDVTLAPRVHILAHDASTKMHLNHTRIGKVKIGNRVFVGTGTIILPGVTIGNDVIIGAGSLVSRNIPDGQVVAGNPAKIICTTRDYLQRKRLEMESCPCFGPEYTTSKDVTDSMKNDMNMRMTTGIGYVV